jgi:hypothetical protein
MRRYSARLTRHKPKINDTKEYARLFMVELVDNILHKGIFVKSQHVII